MGIRLKREKQRTLIGSIVYRLGRLPISDKRKLKLFLNLEWIFDRLVHETSYSYYPPEKHPSREKGIGFITDFIEKDYSVLDLGCSRGEITRRIAEKAKHVVGVDISRESIDKANLNTKDNLQYYCMDARQYLEESNGNFDVLILSHILEHLDEPKQFLAYYKEHFRFIYVEVPDFDRSIFNHFRKELELPLIYSDPDHVNEFDRQELRELIGECGLEIERAEYIFGVQRYWCRHPLKPVL
jgi:SAM-dependent methyltransferase